MIHYQKNDNSNLFNCFKKEDLTNFETIQNYIPIYNNFFKLNSNNYNSINLNHKHSIVEIKSKETFQIFNCVIKKNNLEKCKVFFKFSPLLDPVKYLTGKYKDINTKSIPKFEDNDCDKKMLDVNNSAYIDGFFSYLTSSLLHNNKFINATDYYGSFLGIKKEFNYNIFDDLEYLYDSEYFNETKNDLYKVENFDDSDYFCDSSLKNKKKLQINDSNIQLTIDTLDNEMFGDIFCDNNDTSNKKVDISSNIIFTNIKKKNSTNHTSSTCSSRCSNTSEEEDDIPSEEEKEEDDIPSEEEEEEEEEDSEEDSIYSDDSEYSDCSSVNENLDCTIFDYPVQIICLEKLENTLDSLLEDEDIEISNKEWSSILMQIIMTLITYQKCFKFTHNDLHTNNVMYNKTDRKYICYRYNGKIYKVPTYGKIFKLIDFGRSIYKFKGIQICSDSFHPKGDAATQYNFGPYYNEKKPKIEPNYSFDLCRLACSLYDYFIQEDDIIEELGAIEKLIYSWILDDKGKNILYKKNGDERYPDFKLYKMITRLVHKHTPHKQLENPLFKKFVTSKRKLNKKTKIIDIDAFEDMSL